MQQTTKVSITPAAFEKLQQRMESTDYSKKKTSLETKKKNLENKILHLEDCFYNFEWN